MMRKRITREQREAVLAMLAGRGVSSRSDMRRVEKGLAEITEKLSEADHKLKALRRIVGRKIRGNAKLGEIN